MKIRMKVLLIILVSLAAAAVCIQIFVRTLLVGYIEKEEISSIDLNYKRSIPMLQKEEDTLENVARDWSQWDDAYKYIADRNQSFIESNLQPDELGMLKVNFIVILDKDYHLINFLGQGAPELQEKTVRRLAKDIRAEKFRTGKEPVTGMTVLNGKPVILSLAPVTSSDGSAPTNGYFVFVKYISRDFIQYIEQALQVKIDLDVSQLKQGNELITGRQSDPFRFEKTSRTITAYSKINDLLGANQIILKIVSNRRNYQDGMLVVRYFGVAFLIILILLAGVCALTVDRLITHRISLLHTFVSKVADSSDTSAEIHIPGNDEIAVLGRNMNSMLHRLNGSYAELRVREERFRLIMEATNDGYFDMDLVNNTIYISPAWLACIGYPESDGRVGFEEHISHIYPEDLQLFEKARTKYLSGETDQLRLEYRVLKGNGEPVWTTIRGKAAEFDENGRPTRIIGMISDITGRKKYEEENHYLLQMDTTTDLKNRTYMENLLRNMEQRGESGSSLIIGDVNGLKLMNDTFGHQEGDRLLGTIGGILRRCCGEEAIPSRWGGDEFLILAVDRDEAYVEDLIQRIRDVCERAENFPIRISIAWGWAQWDENHSRTDDLLKLAEERMYRNKLLESRSARSAIIASLKQSLHEKHIETVEHTKRIQQMCMKVGAYLGMSQEELDELALLAILHDIGKIAIPEAVLLKPGKLTEKEWEIMKTHTEIGYRIAASTPELAHIAGEILSHHERVDGNGYPNGLAGSEIPKMSRLLAIVDSYDVMVHDRVYKKAISREEAVKELKACSGKQFDPEMTEAFLKLLEATPGDLEDAVPAAKDRA